MHERTKALVLGGGGPVGVGWEVGLAAGLAEHGVQLGEADHVVGTSAGSITGAFLAAGADPKELAGEVTEIFRRSLDGSGVDVVDVAAVAELMDLQLGMADDGADPATQLARIGRLALDASTVDEGSFVRTLTTALEGREWSDRFRCTAVDAGSGDFAVWAADSGVPLARAVASSCAVPGIYPPVTIEGRRYLDGGARSPLNADLAAGHDAVVVVSVMPLQLPPGLADERFERYFAAQRAELDALREAGADVEVIEPDETFLEISGYGLALMDFSRIAAAVDAGRDLGEAVAERIAAAW